ncbi:hypothetical protein [Arthrobacter tecti]
MDLESVTYWRVDVDLTKNDDDDAPARMPAAADVEKEQWWT